VHGLTTASTIWLSAAVGVASGMGYYALTIVTVAVGLFVLLAFGMLERLLFAPNRQATRQDHHQKVEPDA
jgi:putative Mg2+ transporter-C (MgtC) family protein